MTTVKEALPSPRLRTVTRPKQARSERTLQRILDAAESLIAEKGLADASIPEIVRRAGSSVGGFYARFRDKNELLHALEERFFVEISQRLDAIADQDRWVHASVPEIVSACIAELVTETQRRCNLIAAFMSRGAQDTDIIDHALQFRRAVAERISALLLPRADFHHPDPALAIGVAVHVAFALMEQRVLVGELAVGGHTLSNDDLHRELSRVFLSYIGAPVPSGPTALEP